MARTCILLAALLVATSLSIAHAQDEAEWLTAHNAERSTVGVGPLTWSTTVAAYALSWAQGQAAMAGCPLEHSPDDGPYGENIAYWTNSGNPTPTSVVASWAAEKANYTYESNACSAVCGHYTQVVWANSTSLGCASVPCSDVDATFFICSYDPPGNLPGQKPY